MQHLKAGRNIQQTTVLQMLTLFMWGITTYAFFRQFIRTPFLNTLLPKFFTAHQMTPHFSVTAKVLVPKHPTLCYFIPSQTLSYPWSIFFVSALLWDCSLCWDQRNGTWHLHLPRPCYVALGQVLIWVIHRIGWGAINHSLIRQLTQSKSWQNNKKCAR